MANFVLIYTGGSMPETDEEQKAVMAAWTSWYSGLGDAVVDMGNPFTPMAKSISADGSISDGAVGTAATGYTILAADSIDDALGMAKNCPVLQGGSAISVYETFNVM